VAESTRPGPGACRPPFPPEFDLQLSLPGIVTYPSHRLEPGPSRTAHGLISRICAMIMSVVPAFRWPRSVTCPGSGRWPGPAD